MKLNNKGWGLNTLLIIGSCLLIFLLIAAYYIYVLYRNKIWECVSVNEKIAYLCKFYK